MPRSTLATTRNVCPAPDDAGEPGRFGHEASYSLRLPVEVCRLVGVGVKPANYIWVHVCKHCGALFCDLQPLQDKENER